MTKNQLTLLLYHGVTEAPSKGIENFSGKHIAAEEFRRQMHHIKTACTPLSMDDIVDLARSGDTIPDRAVAVTFDDGYKNNHAVAAPILDEYGLPAVFYVCAGMVGTNMMFATDIVEDCINLSDEQRISISLADGPETIPITTVEDKIVTVNRIKGHCKLISPEERTRVLAELSAVTGVIPSIDHSANYPMMNWAEVREMDSNNLFTIGGHSLYHHTLSKHDAHTLNLDIKTTLGLLEFNLGHAIPHFAYPEGQSVHYNDHVIETLKHEGVICSPSAIDGINESAADLFNLRRIMVGFNDNPFPFDSPAAATTA
ncbi:MAG: polysaccharide deacetylase family protein [Rhodospirillales bacterium]